MADQDGRRELWRAISPEPQQIDPQSLGLVVLPWRDLATCVVRFGRKAGVRKTGIFVFRGVRGAKIKAPKEAPSKSGQYFRSYGPPIQNKMADKMAATNFGWS
jgi:hypothetical protein